MGLKSREEVRRNMQAIKSKNTKIEILLGKALWSRGYRYRKHNKAVFGKPDFTFKKYKIAIFCDSEFWHGKDWDILKKRLTTNPEYWLKKIERNIQRDLIVNEELDKMGWTVLRFWEKEIKKNLTQCMEEIIRKIKEKQALSNI
jgi:DNA mismatch endonuclease (patch repair protein)